MLCFRTLASGSGGNAVLVSGGGTHILIDAGISWRRITTALRAVGLTAEDLSAILITHEHADHIGALATMVKHNFIPVYASQGTARQLNYRIAFPADQLRAFSSGDGFAVGSLRCSSFSTSHDAADSVGYTVELEDCKLALVTDLGCVTPVVRTAVLGSDAVIVESNHDEDWLRSGPYPYMLQQRILGSHGHLSNEAGAELAAQAVMAGAKTVVLAHLSHENNTPARAFDVTARRLSACGIDPEKDIRLLVAPRAELSPELTAGKEVSPC